VLLHIYPQKMARQVLAVQAGQGVLPELLGLVWVLLQAALMRAVLAQTVTVRIEAVGAGQVAPRLGMGFREPLAHPLAVVVVAVGDQVEAFIAAVGLGRITVLTEFLPVPLR
jgi:hypothetical protein